MALLGPDEPAPFRLGNPGGRAPALVLCDHASPRVPRALDRLGLAPARFEEHIAYDIGAGQLADAIALSLDAPCIRSGYSRLVVDPNRFPDDPASVPESSDGVLIPGNRELSETDREARLAAVFRPYHRAIAQQLDAAPEDLLIVSVHTFTPVLGGRQRPWHVGVLWNEDARIAPALIEALRERRDLCVGDNQPYSATAPLGYTMVTHCEGRRLPHALLEIRQDLVSTAEGIAAWAEILGPALRAVWPPLRAAAARG